MDLHVGYSAGVLGTAPIGMSAVGRVHIARSAPPRFTAPVANHLSPQ